MLRYRDFAPRMLEEPGLFSAGHYETFDDAVTAANAWIVEERIQLISIETVVLPNIFSRWEEGTKDGSLGTSGDSPSRWHQVLRCWYRDNSQPSSHHSNDSPASE